MYKKLLSLVLFGMLLVTGCEMFNPIGPIIQIGTMWMNGEAQKYYNTEQTPMIQAVKDVLKALDMPIQKEEENGAVYYIQAGDKGSDRFKIKITAVRHNVTKLSIRINTLGDKPYAEMIYRHVDIQPGIKTFMTTVELNKAVNKKESHRRNKDR